MIRCGHCQGHHHSTAQVRVCGTGTYHDPDTGQTHTDCHPCDWLMDTGRYDEDGQKVIRECAHPSWVDERGWRCAAGHEHVTAEIRYAERWDYADPDEAPAMARKGIRPVHMDGSVFLDCELV